MALTVAERQARYRQRLREKGLKQRWVDPTLSTQYDTSKPSAEFERGQISGYAIAGLYFICKRQGNIAHQFFSDMNIDRQKLIDNRIDPQIIEMIDKSNIFTDEGKLREINEPEKDKES